MGVCGAGQVCGGLSGDVQLRDPRSLHSQFRISAHTGPVLSLDVKGDLLVTCGMSLFRREYSLEPAVKVPRPNPRPAPTPALRFG